MRQGGEGKCETRGERFRRKRTPWEKGAEGEEGAAPDPYM